MSSAYGSSVEDVDEREPALLEPRSAPTGSEERAAEVALSVIVVVSERPEPLDAFYREYAPAIARTGLEREFVFVLEPFARSLRAPLEALQAEGEPIRIVQARRTMPEAELLDLALAESRGDILLTLPAYHRVEPDSLPALVERVRAGADVAVAARWPRRDPLVNRVQSRVFHALVGAASTGRFRDIASGVRAMRRRVLAELPLYGDFLRFLPLLAVQAGFEVEEIECPQHPRDQQPRVYGPGVYLRRVIDVLGIGFLLRFTFKPLRFFGLIGSILAVPGAVILLYLLAVRLGGNGIAGRPLLLLGVLLLTLGVQIVALGLVGELIVHLEAPGLRRYRVADETEEPE